MKIVEQLADIQEKLKAPKGQHNNFGNYNYRSCEDILEALKPLLKESGLTLTLDDSIESAGNRIYIKATAKLQNSDGESIENHAFAREAETKKGMDDSQITGTASSYARKYALNGMFLIDDAKDADSNEYKNQQDNAKSAISHKPLKCSKCGAEIKSVKAKNGKIISAQAVADKYGMCLACLQKEIEAKKAAAK